MIASKRAVECDTIETNGSAINEQTLEVIEMLNKVEALLY